MFDEAQKKKRFWHTKWKVGSAREGEREREGFGLKDNPTI